MKYKSWGLCKSWTLDWTHGLDCGLDWTHVTNLSMRTRVFHFRACGKNGEVDLSMPIVISSESENSDEEVEPPIDSSFTFTPSKRLVSCFTLRLSKC